MLFLAQTVTNCSFMLSVIGYDVTKLKNMVKLCVPTTYVGPLLLAQSHIM